MYILYISSCSELTTRSHLTALHSCFNCFQLLLPSPLCQSRICGCGPILTMPIIRHNTTIRKYYSGVHICLFFKRASIRGFWFLIQFIRCRPSSRLVLVFTNISSVRFSVMQKNKTKLYCYFKPFLADLVQMNDKPTNKLYGHVFC